MRAQPLVKPFVMAMLFDVRAFGAKGLGVGTKGLRVFPKKLLRVHVSSKKIEARTSNEKHTRKSRMRGGSSMGFGVAQWASEFDG